MKEKRKDIIKEAKRILVKIGSSVLASGEEVVFRLAVEVDNLKKSGREIVIVSSGAIATGMKRLNLRERPATIPERQAVAAVGQGGLISLYDSAFSRLGHTVAQILLTHDDFADRKRFLNARNTVFTLLRFDIIPVINENDTVAVDEIKFGDNDHLAALATNLIEADLLVMLTDIDGIYDKNPAKDPSARRIPVVEDVDGLELTWTDERSRYGTGGIKSKVDSARKASHFGTATIVVSGLEEKTLDRIFNLEDVGTFFAPAKSRLTSKKHWIAFSARPTGRVFVDDGAREAVLLRGKSLLPSGIRDVDGRFEAGEVVHCVDLRGMEFARGVINYSSDEVRRIKGLRTENIERVLGYKVYDEVIHRDNLVVL